MSEPSGDAANSYNRYREDVRLLADSGLTMYRFGIEWARIEPVEGCFSKAELLHYRAMIDACHEFGVEPMVTIYHFHHAIVVCCRRWMETTGCTR